MVMKGKWKSALALMLSLCMLCGCGGGNVSSSSDASSGEVSSSETVSSNEETSSEEESEESSEEEEASSEEESEESSEEEVSSEEESESSEESSSEETSSSESSSSEESSVTSSEESSSSATSSEESSSSSSSEPVELTYWTDTEHYGITVTSGGDMMLGDEKLYVAGVNCYNLFNQCFDTFTADKAKADLDILADNGVKAVRFNCGIYSAAEFDYYFDNKPTYTRVLRQIARHAAELEIGLIPSFFWTTNAVPDYYDEPIGHWGHSDSQTIGFMRDYVQTVVGALKNDKAIFAWEFGNEFNLDCNIGIEHVPKLPANSKRASRTEEDCLSAPDVQYAYTQFVSEIRAIDTTGRMITSGNSTLRPAQYNLYHNGTWKQDTQAQYKEMTAMFTPDGMTAVGEHAYFDDETNLNFTRFGGTMTLAEYITMAMSTAKSLGKAYFVGEWGGTKVQQNYMDIGDTLVDCGVQLSLIWNFSASGSVEGSFSANTTMGQNMFRAVQNMNFRYETEF